MTPPIGPALPRPFDVEERDAIEQMDADDFARVNRRANLYGVLLHRCLLALPVEAVGLRADIHAAFRPDLDQPASRENGA